MHLEWSCVRSWSSEEEVAEGFVVDFEEGDAEGEGSEGVLLRARVRVRVRERESGVGRTEWIKEKSSSIARGMIPDSVEVPIIVCVLPDAVWP